MEILKLSELLHVRITKQMKDSIYAKAQNLGIRPADIVRMSLAHMLSGQTETKLLNLYREKDSFVDNSKTKLV